ncbi:hypothetical protein CVT25_008969 [Psilocybe cyanescens]|uniref:GST N-terminal domain-containing protein n=1 Tax=Psilocybe cyanescens TaxID=93625 RepID=A0A409XN07_PSICY|nr:hypothetical protein CVT25_008969 [Psilocybe cyanescens]
MAKQITLYTAKVCPWAHRTELALKESKLPYTRYEIDLSNKPEWYAPKVNKASKVPAIAYGGPDASPENPSPESVKIAESGVLLEFFADLDRENRLLPKDPVLRAKARFFIETATPAFTGALFGAVSGTKDVEALFDGIDVIQGLLPVKGYAIGEWSIADAAITPFFARTEVSLKNDIGKFEAGKGKAAWAKIETEPRFSRFRQYFSDLKNRDSYKETFDEEFVKNNYAKRFARDV